MGKLDKWSMLDCVSCGFIAYELQDGFAIGGDEVEGGTTFIGLSVILRLLHNSFKMSYLDQSKT